MLIGKIRSKMHSIIKSIKKRRNTLHSDKVIPTMNIGTEYGSFAVAGQIINTSGQNGGGVTVYSFGIGEDLSFSQGMLGTFDCNIYAFDPTPKAIAYVAKHQLSCEPRFHFYPIGLSSKDEIAEFYLPKNTEYVSGSVQERDELQDTPIKVKMKCLSTIMKELGHTKIDVLKMDIEGSEFEAIENILATNIDFGQLCIEVHNRFFPDGVKRLRHLYKALKHSGHILCNVSNDELLFVKESLLQ